VPPPDTGDEFDDTHEELFFDKEKYIDGLDRNELLRQLGVDPDNLDDGELQFLSVEEAERLDVDDDYVDEVFRRDDEPDIAPPKCTIL